jgi:uncharacterized protein YutE (UPF0331/DUF86 family)
MALDREILAERASALERHLKRVSLKLPQNPVDFVHGTDASDAVILHLWQAVQLTIDTALSICVHLHLGSPSSYAGAFFKLSEATYLDKELAVRLAHAAGFRNRIVHGYEELDMQKIYKIAHAGPHDLRAFFASVRNLLN